VTSDGMTRTGVFPCYELPSFLLRGYVQASRFDADQREDTKSVPFLPDANGAVY